MNFFEKDFTLFLKNNFEIAKNIRGFLENLFEYHFLNIIVDINLFSDLKFEYYCEYFPEILLHVSLK